MIYTEKAGTCGFCKGEILAKLHVNFACNGAQSFTWVCPSCKRMNPFRSNEIFISKEKVCAVLSADEINALPVLMPQLYGRCVVCGNREAELHHWAPRAYFGNDSEIWPKDYLCKPCHDKWHALVTPEITGKVV